MKNYVSLQEIMEIYCLAHHTADEIVKKYCTDKYRDEKDVYVKSSEFHNVYITRFNPSLFPWENKEANILTEAFSEPIRCKQKKLKRLNMVCMK